MGATFFLCPFKFEYLKSTNFIAIHKAFSWLPTQFFTHQYSVFTPKRDLMAIVSALEYNTFFRGLKVSNTRLSNDTLDRILHVLKRSMWLEELHLEGLGLKADFIHKLAVSVISNNNPALKTIDLKHNLIEDKGESLLHIHILCDF